MHRCVFLGSPRPGRPGGGPDCRFAKEIEDYLQTSVRIRVGNLRLMFILTLSTVALGEDVSFTDSGTLGR